MFHRGTARRHRRLRSTIVGTDTEPHRKPHHAHHRKWLRISPKQAAGLLQHQEVHQAYFRQLTKSDATQSRQKAAAEDGGEHVGMGQNSTRATATSLANLTSDFMLASGLGGQVE